MNYLTQNTSMYAPFHNVCSLVSTDAMECLYSNPSASAWIEIHPPTTPRAWEWLHLNPDFRAIRLLFQNPTQIIWDKWASNVGLIEYESHITKRVDSSNVKLKLMEHVVSLCKNPHPKVIPWIEEYLATEKDINKVKQCIFALSNHFHAVHLLSKYFDHICWRLACQNQNPKIVPLLKKAMDKKYSLSWNHLFANPATLSLFKKDMDKCLDNLPKAMPNEPDDLPNANLKRESWLLNNIVTNPNPQIVEWLQKYVSKGGRHLNMHSMSASPLTKVLTTVLCIHEANWTLLLANPSAIPLIEKHWDSINNDGGSGSSCNNLLRNPNAMHLLFPLNKKAIAECKQLLHRELLFVTHFAITTIA